LAAWRLGARFLLSRGGLTRHWTDVAGGATLVSAAGVESMRGRGEAMSEERPVRAGLRLVRPADTADVVALETLRRREPAAVGAFFDRHAAHVERLLRGVLGPDPDIPDLVQQTFLEALSSLPGFRSDAGSLVPWLNRIAVFTARRHIRRRSVRRWVRFAAPEALPDPPASAASPAVLAALRRTYALLDRLATDERIAFALRFVRELELTEVAEAMGVSLATVKRRLERGRERFLEWARHDPVLRGWLEEKDHGP
jgi:RNA polymerase sigma-70 factor (ECF subfamily)